MPIEEGLVALTVTPGSTPPLLSATLPLIDPVVLAPPPCANACVEASRQAASTATTKWNPRRFMNALLFLNTRTLQPPCAFGPVVQSEQANTVLDRETRSLASKMNGRNDLQGFFDKTTGDNWPIIQDSGSSGSAVRIRSGLEVLHYYRPSMARHRFRALVLALCLALAWSVHTPTRGRPDGFQAPQGAT